jgi:hypothetical protein
LWRRAVELSIKAETISNCFRKGGFIVDSESQAATVIGEAPILAGVENGDAFMNIDDDDVPC